MTQTYMLDLRLKEIIIGLIFAILHIGFYHQLSTQTVVVEKTKPRPVLLEIIHPKPKPVPIPIPEPKVVPPKLKEPPPVKKPPPKVKKVVKKTIIKRVVEKPRLQQKSMVKVQADEIVEKEVVERPQQLHEARVEKPDNKPVEKAEPEPAPEPRHEPVITKVTGIGGCSSTLNNYPAEAREQGLEGTVKIKMRVLADGSVTGVSIVKSSGHSILDQSVLANAADCNLDPAEKDGVPIPSTVVIPVRFKLNN